MRLFFVHFPFMEIPIDAVYTLSSNTFMFISPVYHKLLVVVKPMNLSRQLNLY